MSEASIKPRKTPGRHCLVSPENREEIRRLYFDEGWTATKIKAERYPSLLKETIRKIAHVEAERKARKENAPEAATCGGSTTDTGVPASATDTSVMHQDASAQGGAQPQIEEV